MAGARHLAGALSAPARCKGACHAAPRVDAAQSLCQSSSARMRFCAHRHV